MRESELLQVKLPPAGHVRCALAYLAQWYVVPAFARRFAI